MTPVMRSETRPPLVLPAAPTWIETFETAPGWMRWSGAALLGYTLFLLTPTGGRVSTSGVVDVATQPSGSSRRPSHMPSRR